MIFFKIFSFESEFANQNLSFVEQLSFDLLTYSGFNERRA